MATLKKSIEEAFKKSAGMAPTDSNPNIEKLSEDLSVAIKDWLLKQEFRIDEMEVPLNVEKIETNGEIKNTVAKTAKKGVGAQPALNVEGTAVFSTTSTPSTQKPSGIAKKSKVRLYPGEVKDTGD